MEKQAIFPLKVLMRKTAYRRLLLTWSENKFNATTSFHFFKLLKTLRNAMQHKATNSL
jgi:hypothetical protein